MGQTITGRNRSLEKGRRQRRDQKPNPSQKNQAAFDRAVAEVTRATHRLLEGLSTQAAPRNRSEEAEKARERRRKRFDSGPANLSRSGG